MNATRETLKDTFLEQVWTRQSGRARCIHKDTREHDLRCARSALNDHPVIQDGIAEIWSCTDKTDINDLRQLIKSGTIGMCGPRKKIP